jgi:hypothetical protein
MLALFLLATLLQGPAGVEALTAASDAVARATVLRSESHWAPAGGLIFTTVTLRLLETWKGPLPPEFQVLVQGGSAGGYDQNVQGVARFSAGEEVVLFLNRRTQGVYTVSKMSLGKFSVKQQRAVRSRRGLECHGCAPDEQDDFSLDELRAKVRH